MKFSSEGQQSLQRESARQREHPHYETQGDNHYSGAELTVAVAAWEPISHRVPLLSLFWQTLNSSSRLLISSAFRPTQTHHRAETTQHGASRSQPQIYQHTERIGFYCVHRNIMLQSRLKIVFISRPLSSHIPLPGLSLIYPEGFQY